MSKLTKNDLAWQKLLEALNIDLSAADYPIHVSMGQLARQGGREPRLMLSMDSRSKWPVPLKEHRVVPISTSTKDVYLVKGDAWFDLLDVPSAPSTFTARLPFRLASSTVGRGENAHIVRLETSGFLAKFLSADRLVPVASGKRMSPPFSFTVGPQQLQVNGAQYEMDAQYESFEDIIPVEMKTKHYDSCAIRQVYYPYRSLGEDTNWEKPVRPLFITHDQRKEDYVIRELGFRVASAWDSIYQVQSAGIHLKLEEPPRDVIDLKSVEIDDKRIPQADNVRRIAEFPLLVQRGISSAELVAEYYEFDVRQSSYYRDAAQSLGLVRSEGGRYRLTADGKRYVAMPPQGRADLLARRMSRLPVVRCILEALDDAASHGLSQDQIPNLLQEYARAHGQPLNSTTAKRRASTLASYLRYMGSRTGGIIASGRTFYMRHDVPSLDHFMQP